MIKIRHVSFINGAMIHEYKEIVRDYGIELTYLDRGVWVIVPQGQLTSMGHDMNSIIRNYTVSGWTVHGDCTTVQSHVVETKLDFVNATATIEKHLCRCDLKGANCWLGCRCGGR